MFFIFSFSMQYVYHSSLAILRSPGVIIAVKVGASGVGPGKLRAMMVYVW